jgi:hypothetical protein
VVVVFGGWWLGYKAWQGDWNSFKAMRLAHPWGVADPEYLQDSEYWASRIAQIVRSYYAMFSGALFIGVPDLAILAWLGLPFAVLSAAAVVSRLGAPAQPGPTEGGFNARRLALVTLAGTCICNVAAVLANLRFFTAPYGRLLFPSLIATHTLAAAVLARLLRGRPRALATAALVVVAGYGLLFGWAFARRLAPAVRQPPEDVRALNDVGTSWSMGPVWELPVEQELLIPAGSLSALRVDIMRTNCVPQLGATLEGALEFIGPDGGHERVPLRRTALGDNDFSLAWMEIELQQPLHLDRDTPALLTLRGTPPVWPTELTQFRYMCCADGVPAQLNGTPTQCPLCVAAVYRP